VNEPLYVMISNIKKMYETRSGKYFFETIRSGGFITQNAFKASLSETFDILNHVSSNAIVCRHIMDVIIMMTNLPYTSLFQA
jgi:hypothetical protein